MSKYILKETIQTFKTSDTHMLTEALERAFHNDMYNIFLEINKEINALPKYKKEKLKKIYIQLLNNEINTEENNGKTNNNNKIKGFST